MYRLTIAPVVGALAFRRQTGKAEQLLEDLVAHRFLFRHQDREARYYTLEPTPFSRREIRESFALLWFCCMQHRPPVSLLGYKQIELFIRETAGLQDLVIPRMSPCYLDDSRIALLRVNRFPPDRSGDLNAVMQGLQDFVNGEGFRPWWALAQVQRFVLTYLIESPLVAELSRWLSWHPLVSRLGASPLCIPVNVHEEQRLAQPK
jgi:hypothetical protein